MRIEVPPLFLGISSGLLGCASVSTATPEPTRIPTRTSEPTRTVSPTSTLNPARISREGRLVSTKFMVQDRLFDDCLGGQVEARPRLYDVFSGEVWRLTTNWSIEGISGGMVLEQETAPYDKMHLASDGRKGLRTVLLQEGNGPEMLITATTSKSFRATMKCPVLPMVDSTPTPTP